TYWTPSLTMTPAWIIDAANILHESLDTSDAGKRHRVVVRWRDMDGDLQETVAEDFTYKKSNEPVRTILIEEADTSAIRDQAAAERFANAVLHASKTKPATDSLRVPFTPYMRLFDVIQVTNPAMSDESELYAIEELRLSFSSDEWTTEVVAS